MDGVGGVHENGWSARRIKRCDKLVRYIRTLSDSGDHDPAGAVENSLNCLLKRTVYEVGQVGNGL